MNSRNESGNAVIVVIAVLFVVLVLAALAYYGVQEFERMTGQFDVRRAEAEARAAQQEAIEAQWEAQQAQWEAQQVEALADLERAKGEAQAAINVSEGVESTLRASAWAVRVQSGLVAYFGLLAPFVVPVTIVVCAVGGVAAAWVWRKWADGDIQPPQRKEPPCRVDADWTAQCKFPDEVSQEGAG